MFELRADGVYDISGENDEHICGPLWVLAATRNRTDANWGRMLEWIDKGGKLHRRAVAMDKLSGSRRRSAEASPARRAVREREARRAGEA